MIAGTGHVNDPAARYHSRCLRLQQHRAARAKATRVGFLYYMFHQPTDKRDVRDKDA